MLRAWDNVKVATTLAVVGGASQAAAPVLNWKFLRPLFGTGNARLLIR